MPLKTAPWVAGLSRRPNGKFASTAEVHGFVGIERPGLLTDHVEFVYRYYGRLLTLLSARRRRDLQGSIEPVGHEYLLEALEHGRGAVLVSAHLGDFDLAGSWLTQVDG